MKKALTTAAIGSGLLVLIGLAIVRRRPAVENGLPARPPPAALDVGVPEGPVRATRPNAERTSPEVLARLETRRTLRHAEQDFWEDLGVLLEQRSKMEPERYREKVSALTTEYLRLDPARAALFTRSAAAATEEIGRAWKLRNESIEALSGTSSREERERKEAQMQEAYEAAKVQAVAPLESLLDSSPRHEVFRQRLGEWLDVVR